MLENSQLKFVAKEVKWLLLLNDKILALSKFNAFADDSFSVALIVQFVFERIENTVGKEKQLVTSTFSFSHNVFEWPRF